VNPIYEEPRQSFVLFNGLEVLVEPENPRFLKVLQWYQATGTEVMCAQNPDKIICDDVLNEKFHQDLVNEANI
jgi:hypothetical protein